MSKITLNKKMFVSSLKTAVKCISKEESRDSLKMVYLQGGANFTMVATDGHILYKKVLSNVAIDSNILLSKENVNHILDLLKKERTTKDSTVDIDTTKKALIVNDKTFYTAITENPYPNYERGIVDIDTLTNSATFSSKELAQLLKDNKDNIGKRSNLTIFDLTDDDIENSISFRKEFTDTKTTSVNIAYKGNDLRLGLSAKYLKQVLATTKKDITMNCGSAISQTQYHIDKSEMFLIMPLRIF